MSVYALCARIVLAAVFGVAGVAKLADLDGSRSALESFGVPRAAARAGSVVIPVVEVLIAISLLLPVTAWWAAGAAVTLLLVFMGAIGASVARGTSSDCHCFGQLHSAPAGWRAFARNAALAGVGAAVLAGGHAASQLSPVSWLGGVGAPKLVVGAVAAALIAALAVQGWFLLELVRQQGRILARLDGLEARLAAHGAGTARWASGSIAHNGNGRVLGLPVGAPAPEFELATLGETRVTLGALRARRAPVLLVFSDPECGPCNALLPQLGTWQRRYAGRLTIALISRGSPDQNVANAAEHRLSDVLVQGDREVVEDYQANGTPSAVLVSVDGTIASSLSAGTAAITDLVDRSTAPGLDVVPAGAKATTNGRVTAPSPAPGVAVGSRAPDLRWTALDGRELGLADFRGSRVVLAFWNPECGFCQRLLPALREWEANSSRDSPQLLVVSTGQVKENRALGLIAPIVLERDFETGRLFRAGGTPSAVLIDARGCIAAPVAVGGPAILDLIAPEYAETRA
jgi:peroxiredoxin/uncharacterized membrane protein YphA (DoxX/SURF4 family)